MDWNGIDRIWFLTWTTYGTWLPGDERGFVSPKFAGDIPSGGITSRAAPTTKAGLTSVASPRTSWPVIRSG